MRRTAKIALSVNIFLCLSASSSFADQIDGTWCSPTGESMTIKGEQVVTPGGNAITGRYTRHHFDYEVPGSEKNAGDVVSADQINDENIQVKILRGAERIREKSVIWQRCDVVSQLFAVGTRWALLWLPSDAR